MGFVFNILLSYVMKKYTKRIVYVLVIASVLGTAYFLYSKYESAIIGNATNRLQLEQLARAEKERERLKSVIDQLHYESSQLADTSDEEIRRLMERRDRIIAYVTRYEGSEPVPGIVKDVIGKLVSE